MVEELNQCSCSGTPEIKRETLFGGHGRDPEDRVQIVCGRCGSNICVSDWPGHIKQADVAALKVRWNRLHPVRNSGESPTA